MSDEKKDCKDARENNETVPMVHRSLAGMKSISDDSPLSRLTIEELTRIVSRVTDKTTVVVMGETIEESGNPNGLGAFLKTKRGD